MKVGDLITELRQYDLDQEVKIDAAPPGEPSPAREQSHVHGTYEESDRTIYIALNDVTPDEEY